MKRPIPGAVARALLEIQGQLEGTLDGSERTSLRNRKGRKSARTFDTELFHEQLLFLDGEDQLNPVLERAFFRSGAYRARLRLARSLQAADPSRIDPTLIVEILYRVFTGVFPDPEGARIYGEHLKADRLSPLEIAHILAFSRKMRLFGQALFSPGLLRHVLPALGARIRLFMSRPGSDARASHALSASRTVLIQHRTEPGTSQSDPGLISRAAPAANRHPRIALVIHRAGADFSGGAEREAMAYARYLSKIADVEILTTCAKDYLTWADHYPPGVWKEDGLTIRRFQVARPRNPVRFHRISSILRPLVEFSAESSSVFRSIIRGLLKTFMLPLSLLWMREQGPNCPSLLKYLRSNREDYDLFFFSTYLYDTTYSGLPIVAERAVLIPTAHPEWPLRLPIWGPFFGKVRRVIFNAEEERQFLRAWFPGIADGPVLGCGLDPHRSDANYSFRRAFGITGPFLLYTGRIDPEKGCRHLIGLFLRYLNETESKLTLVLLGSKAMAVPAHPRILAPGFVSQEALDGALSECAVYVHPSPYESLSFSLLEAMQAGRPVLATAKSDVLRGHVLRSRAGLCYRDADDFFVKLDQLLRSPERFSGGPAYVRRRYSHSAVRGPMNRWTMAEIEAMRDFSEAPPDLKTDASLSR